MTQLTIRPATANDLGRIKEIAVAANMFSASYAGLGYDEETRIPEFYGPCDHKVVFWKQIN